MVQEHSPIPPQPYKRKSSPQLWRWFLPPMLLLSLGLHGLVLFSPVAPSEEEVVPPPDPEEDGIAITKIDPPKPRAATAPPPANASTVKTASPNAAAAAGANRSAPATNPARSNPAARTGGNANRQRQGATNATTASNRTNRTAQTRVPDLPARPVQNPNPNAPGVSPAAPSADPEKRFEEYFNVFETYSGVKVTPVAVATERQALWLSSFTDQGAAYENLTVQSLTNLNPLPYEANICLPSAPAPAKVLVLVEADGRVDGDLQFVQTTGYRSFDRAALRLIANHTFPSASAPRAYLTEITVDYDPNDCEWPPQFDKLPNEYFTVLENYIGPDLTTLTEAEAAETAWLEDIKTAGAVRFANPNAPAAIALDPLTTSVEYPLSVCLPIQPQDARWGVVVNPDGSLQGEPELLRSTGYRNFDQRSRALVEAFDFPVTEAAQAYRVEVPVDYNDVNCQRLDAVSLAPPRAANRPARNNPRPTANGPAPAAFNADRQAELVATGRRNVEGDPVGGFNSDPGLLAAMLESGWPAAVDRSCFLAEVDPEAGPVPVDAAEDALVLSENFDFVPTTLSKLYSVEVADADQYCGAPLYEMKVNGTPQLFASAVGFGAGNANALVVIWSADPR